MRPDRFETYTLGLLAAHPAVARAAALRDLGETRYPYGVAVQLVAGGEYRWQITAESAPGDTYTVPEQPGDGQPPNDTPAPASVAPGPYGLADADAFLAHVLTADRSRELRTVERRDGGLTVRCHNRARLYLRALSVPATARAGR